MTKPFTRRQLEIAGVAAPVFLKHGFAGTTMSMVADAVGLTRPGLYVIFRDKEALFIAALTVMDRRLHEALQAGLARRRSCRTRLAYVCGRWVAGVYEAQLARPQAKDIDDLSLPIVRQVYQRFVDLIARLLREGREDEITADEAQAQARVIVFGIRGLAATAAGVADMRRLVGVLIDGVLAASTAATRATAAGRSNLRSAFGAFPPQA